ncbi:MAG: glutamyl-tRNA reductase, partial [Planctomycetota bacterium]|nr:glutamyl-tRNA reductase [Planctomycetota bacterium]
GLAAAAYAMEDEEAVAHAVEVAISLDSMVVGEAEILGQMKDAYRAAREAGTAGPAISRVMERTFQAAKEVRSGTGICRGNVSVASAAVTLASKVFDGLKGRSVL